PYSRGPDGPPPGGKRTRYYYCPRSAAWQRLRSLRRKRGRAPAATSADVSFATLAGEPRAGTARGRDAAATGTAARSGEDLYPRAQGAARSIRRAQPSWHDQGAARAGRRGLPAHHRGAPG